MNYANLTLEQVLAMPVIRQGYTDNLIHEGDGVKVWHSRLTTADGAGFDNEITIELYNSRNGWYSAVTYEAV